MTAGQPSPNSFQPAKLDQDTIARIRGLEAHLDADVCLLAVKRPRLFVIEAKISPNEWKSIHTIYPQLDMSAYYTEKDDAVMAKSAIKSLLNGKWKQRIKKHPLRIRQIGRSS